MTGQETATWIERWPRAHHNRPVTVADLAAAMDLSVRRVQAICRAHLGQFTMTLLRGTRLDRARAALLAAGPAPVPTPATVAAVAAAAGFTRVTRFNAAYQQRFAETPTQTLRRNRRAYAPASTTPGRPSAIEAVIDRWGQAFIIAYARDRWLAMRRDDGLLLPAGTLTQLEAEMTAELAKRPLLASTGDDRPHLAEYPGPAVAARFGLASPPAADSPGSDEDDDGDGSGQPADEDEQFLLTALRAAFPAWAITYSTHTRAWIARTRRTTICENSPVLLCAALLLIERRYRQHTSGGQPLR